MLDLYTQVNDLVIMDIFISGKRKYYNLKCQYGHSVDVRCDALKSHRVCSECYRVNARLRRLKRKPSVKVGDTKGQLKVLQILKREINERNKILTLCTCGNETVMLSANFLKENQNFSCGRCLPYYQYAKEGLYVFLKNGDSFIKFLVDEDKSSIVLNKNWTLHQDGSNYYVRGCDENRTMLHRVLTSCPEDKFVDHINGNRLDNRLSNLRIVDKRANSRNTKLNKRNSSGKMGVHYRVDNGKWRAFIGNKLSRIDLGSFINKKDAIEARERAENDLGYHQNHGRYSEFDLGED